MNIFTGNPGYLPEPEDDRDLDAEELVNTLHESHEVNQLSGDIVDLTQWASPIENQQHLSSCVGNATAGALELLMNVHGVPFKDVSRMFIWYNARARQQNEDKDTGCFIRLAVKGLNKYGVCDESTWPYDLKRYSVRPDWSAYQEATGRKIQSYYSVKGFWKKKHRVIEHALRSHHPVIFGMQVSKQFTHGTSDIWNISTREEWSGRHAMVIVGVDTKKRRYKVRNSWGADWRSEGYVWIPFESYEAANPRDHWIMTGVK